MTDGKGTIAVAGPFNGGGQTGELMRSIDWAKSPGASPGPNDYV